MKNLTRVGGLSLLAALMTLGVEAADLATDVGSAVRPVVRRIFREPRLTRGNTNLLRVQPIDEASWVWKGGEDEKGPVFLRFRKEFDVKPEDGKLLIDVSADERFYLTCDKTFVARGPNRSTVDNWQYNTYELELTSGHHVLEATVWRIGGDGPLAQLSWRGGFVLKADGAFDARLTTGVAKWQVGKLSGIESAGAENGVWGTGSQWKITGSGILSGEPSAWSEAEVVRGPAGSVGPSIYGLRTPGWMLFPSQIPDQTEIAVLPGRAVAATHAADWRKTHAYVGSETQLPEVAAFNNFLSGKTDRFVVPAHTRLQLAWDLGRYICAYPEVTLSAAKGARFGWAWDEATHRASDGLKGGELHARDLIVGRTLAGYGDTFVPVPDAVSTFTTPWFRCGKWCRLDIETGDDPLEVTHLRLIESRYPVELESAFDTPQDASLADIRRISARTMQMCCHEMLFDCPYYEQQMYPGDTRVQLEVLRAMSRDDRMIRRAIELYDLGTRDDGQCPFNWPTRGTQEGATYTLCYLCMYGDYAMNHADRAWLRSRLPGLRKSMAGMEIYENADGLLENLPGWQFMDWVVGWESDGTAPGGRFGQGVNAEANLFWVLAMKSAETTERALGNEGQAQYWAEKRVRLAKKIVETFWSEKRGILADTPEKVDFSEHAQCLALLGDVLPADKARVCFDHLITDSDLKRATVYFTYYLFECYFKFGRGDLFLNRLDLWRRYVAKGLTTTQEAPDSGKNGQHESRSDCHAWGAHPIWFMQTGLAGIRSAAPFFEKVRVAPAPGGLDSLHARHPHPQGWIEADLQFQDGRATGRVTTPVAGTFEYGGQTVELYPGENEIGPAAQKPPVFSAARPVWAKGREREQNLTLRFESAVELTGEEKAVLIRATGCSVYRIRVNGAFAGYGPARGPKGMDRVDEWDVRPFVRKGRNDIEIDVAGYNVPNYYLPDQPSYLQAEVVADGRVAAATGSTSFRVRRLDRVQKVPRYSFQRPYCEVWNVSSAATEETLELATQPTKPLLPRRAAYPDFALNTRAKRLSEGHALYDAKAPDRTQLEADRYVDDSTGAAKTSVWDFGLLDCGFVGVRATAKGKGRVLVVFDEVLTNGRVDFLRGGTMNVVVWNIAEAGSFDLESFEPYAFRYAKFIVDGDIEIGTPQIRTYKSPSADAVACPTQDPDLKKIFEAARETFKQNAVDVFTDCPGRERAGWLCDSYFTARVSKYLTGSLALEELFLENFLHADCPDIPKAMFPMCYPADHVNGNFIPNWAMWLVLELEEYRDRGGNPDLVRRFRPKVLALVDYLATFENTDGLLENLPAWVFVEWSRCNDLTKGVNYPSNMTWARVLEAVAALYGRDDLRVKAANVRETVRRQSDDGTWFHDQALRGKDGRLTVQSDHTETCQYYAFYFGVATRQTHPKLWQTLVEEFGPARKIKNGHPDVPFSNAFIGNYLRLELLQSAGCDAAVRENVKGYFLGMAEKTGTLWEHDLPTASCCHGFASYIAIVIDRMKNK